MRFEKVYGDSASAASWDSEARRAQRVADARRIAAFNAGGRSGWVTFAIVFVLLCGAMVPAGMRELSWWVAPVAIGVCVVLVALIVNVRHPR